MLNFSSLGATTLILLQKKASATFAKVPNYTQNITKQIIISSRFVLTAQSPNGPSFIDSSSSIECSRNLFSNLVTLIDFNRPEVQIPSWISSPPPSTTSLVTSRLSTASSRSTGTEKKERFSSKGRRSFHHLLARKHRVLLRVSSPRSWRPRSTPRVHGWVNGGRAESWGSRSVLGQG